MKVNYTPYCLVLILIIITRRTKRFNTYWGRQRRALHVFPTMLANPNLYQVQYETIAAELPSDDIITGIKWLEIMPNNS